MKYKVIIEMDKDSIITLLSPSIVTFNYLVIRVLSMKSDK